MKVWLFSSNGNTIDSARIRLERARGIADEEEIAAVRRSYPASGRIAVVGGEAQAAVVMTHIGEVGELLASSRVE